MSSSSARSRVSLSSIDPVVTNREVELSAHYNVTPGQQMPVVGRNSPNRVAPMKWGLIPSWSKEPRVKFSTINARAETITSSPVFRTPFRSRRCLVPASGFFEWQATKDGKLPYFIHLKDTALFAFAGLYDVWTDAEGKEFPSYTIITTMPNSLMAPIHSRMPVILRREDEDVWLDKETDSLLYRTHVRGARARSITRLAQIKRGGLHRML